MSVGKTISLAKARADFGVVLRLAQRFGFVKIMRGSQLVGVLTSGQRWQEVEPVSDKEAAAAYAATEAEWRNPPEGHFAEAYTHWPKERRKLEAAMCPAMRPPHKRARKKPGQ